ncbi:MAG: HPr family phosphocarrier protein [Deltaproteobacteria bacterium]|nr:HPr family phosphocarrier protein [Deltaproteobacteria bacterium]
MKEMTTTIINKLGLHARAAAQLVKTANQFQSEIYLTARKQRVNGKSIMGVLMLAAAKGCALTLQADGPDEEQALQQIIQLIENKFGEDE